MGVTEAAAPALLDPLGHLEPLPLEARFYPLGFPLLLRTNSSEVVAAAGESWGEFKPAFETPAIELRVSVTARRAATKRGSPRGGRGPGDGSRGGGEKSSRAAMKCEDSSTGQAGMPAPPDGPVFRSQGHLLALALDRENFAVCDLERGFGFGSFAPDLARNHLYLTFYFLDPMAYVCLSQRYLTPIHAACVARDGNGILLVGGSQAGKSSLVWTCARAGFTYVADDATWLVRSGEPLLIGKCHRMRFRPDALKLIPELAHLPKIDTVIGKHSFEIRTAEVPGLATAARCRPSRIVFLDRREAGPAQVSTLGREETLRRLATARTVVEARVWREQEASMERLASHGGIVLRYSHLDDAVEQIQKLA